MIQKDKQLVNNQTRRKKQGTIREEAKWRKNFFPDKSVKYQKVNFSNFIQNDPDSEAVENPIFIQSCEYKDAYNFFIQNAAMMNKKYFNSRFEFCSYFESSKAFEFDRFIMYLEILKELVSMEILARFCRF